MGLVFQSLLTKGDGLVSGILYDDLGFDYISKFGVTCDSRQPPGMSWSSSIPTDHKNYRPPFASGTMGYSWYMTRASLVGVCKVQCCRDETKAHCPLIGLLLHYDDDSREALGQFRWDRQVSNILTPPIQFRHSDLCRKPYVRDIRERRAEDDEFQTNGDEWRNMSGHCAIWWFGTSGDKLLME
jgi:hypothetical protein